MTEPFEEHRSYLMAVGYRMLGSVSDAEDMVQEAYLRWHGAEAGEEVREPRAYLTRVVVRLCLDRLKSAQAQREIYVGPWLPEPVMEAEPGVEVAEAVSYALMLTLERLSPLERAAFLLHDVFEFEFSEVGRILERSEPSCRQLASRARAHVREEKARYQPTREERERLAQAFAAAVMGGGLEEISELLAEDAVFLSDGGGRAPAALRPIIGRDNIARLLVGLRKKEPLRPEWSVKSVLLNGLAGFVVAGPEGPLYTLALEMGGDELIRAIYTVRNPDKLRHLSRG